MIRGFLNRRRLPSAAAKENPLDDEDLLAECLLRLPSLPSSLPRASLVCKRWRRLVSAPHFLRGFRAHHRKPPLLGFFSQDSNGGNIWFTPALDSPDRVHAARFTLQLRGCSILGCRHGRVLAVNRKEPHFLVWDPVTGDQQSAAFSPAFYRSTNEIHGAVTCAASDEGHAHGGIFACVYSSETGTWGNLISMLWPSFIPPDEGDNQNQPFLPTSCSSTRIGNCIYWLLAGITGLILEFDLGRQSLAVTELPRDAYDFDAFGSGESQFLITHADGGGLGLLVLSLSGFSFQLWKRNPNSDGAAGWMLGNTIELSSLLSQSLGEGA
ncbi:hypothetical protein ACP70R_020134 [Stipagrostis hirtigluma subsp. patula]